MQLAQQVLLLRSLQTVRQEARSVTATDDITVLIVSIAETESCQQKLIEMCRLKFADFWRITDKERHILRAIYKRVVYWFCAVLCWCVFVCAGVCWFLLVSTVMCSFVLVCAGVCWCVMICTGLLWCLVLCVGLCWCVLVCAGVHWCAGVHGCAGV